MTAKEKDIAAKSASLNAKETQLKELNKQMTTEFQELKKAALGRHKSDLLKMLAVGNECLAVVADQDKRDSAE